MEKKQEKQGLIAFHKALARSKDGMTMPEKKLCCLVLSQIRFKDVQNSREIWLDKREIINALGIELSSNYQSYYIRKLAKSMADHSELCFQGRDSEEWDDIPLFGRRKSMRGKIMIKITEDAMPLLEFLRDGEYITLYLQDILRFNNDKSGKRAFQLYEYLRLNCDTRKQNRRELTVKELKDLWEIPKDGSSSYVRKDGKFDRPSFEKYVLDPVFEQLDRCEMVVLDHYCGQKQLYKKIKTGNRIQGYEITYRINLSNQKIQKDTIVDTGQKKKSQKKSTGRLDQYNGFNQRSYDYDELERMLANSPNN